MITTKRFVFHLMLLPTLLLLSAQVAQAADIKFTFNHDGQNVSGFRLYMGDTSDPTQMQVIKEASNPTAREFTYAWPEGQSEKCFGISAYTSLHESAIVTKQDNGADVCVGKSPAPVSGFSFTVQSLP